MSSWPNPFPAKAPREPARERYTRLRGIRSAEVVLFKPSGKYYTTERWTIPERASTPADMIKSPDFRRISGTGKVLVCSQEPWGYPHLL